MKVPSLISNLLTDFDFKETSKKLFGFLSEALFYTVSFVAAVLYLTWQFIKYGAIVIAVSIVLFTCLTYIESHKKEALNVANKIVKIIDSLETENTYPLPTPPAVLKKM